MRPSVVLYLNGHEGALTMRTAYEYADIKCIVLPEATNNDEIVSFAKERSIDIRYRNAETPCDLSNFNQTLLLSSAFPYKIFQDEVQSVTRAINFHAAILPKYRGRHGGVWAMINDEPELGVTAHNVDDGFDSGAVLSIMKFSVHDEMSLRDIQSNLADCLCKLVVRILKCDGNFPSEKGSVENIYWRARKVEDGRINWHMPARNIFLLVRALARDPVYAWSQYNRHKFCFMDVKVVDDKHDQLPGTVIERDGKFYVCAGLGEMIKIIEYSGEGSMVAGWVFH